MLFKEIVYNASRLSNKIAELLKELYIAVKQTGLNTFYPYLLYEKEG